MKSGFYIDKITDCIEEVATLINARQNRMAIFPEAAQKLVNSYYKIR